MKKIHLITALGIISLTTSLIVLREQTRSRRVPTSPSSERLSHSSGRNLSQTPPASAAPTVPLQTDAGHRLLIHNAMEQAPAWGVRYGQEFWRKDSDRTGPKVNGGGVVPASIDLGNVIERVSSAIRLANGADLPQAHTRSYAATFDGEGFRLSPHRFTGYTYDASGGNDSGDARAAASLKPRSIYEPDPSTEVRFKTASVRMGGTELYADDAQSHTWSILGNTAQRLLNPELGMVEHYEAQREGVEVTWVMSQRPSQLGNLEIEAELAGLSLLYEDQAGLHFGDQGLNPRVLVGQCIIADQTGKQFQVPMLADGTKLRAVVAEPVLAQMAFPVAIDPVIGPEVGMGLPMAQMTQYQAAAASNGTNYLAVWTDLRGCGSNFCGNGDIYGARITSGGKLLDPSGIAITTNTNSEGSPRVASNGAEFLVVWLQGGGSGVQHVRGARVQNDGTVLDTAGLSITTSDATRSPTDGPYVACNGTNYLVVWHQDSLVQSTGFSINGARVSSAGSILDPDGFVINDSNDAGGNPAYQFDPRVASDKADFLVIWTDFRSGVAPELYYTKVLNSGAVADSGSVIETNVGGHAVAYASSATNYLVVFYTATGTFPYYETWGRSISKSGSLIGSGKFLIAGGAGSGHWSEGEVDSNGTNFLVLVNNTSQFMGVRVRASDEAILDSSPFVITHQANSGNPSVASDGKDYLAVWEVDAGEPENGGDVYGGRISAGGVPLDWFPIGTSEAEDDAQRFPAVVNNAGTYFVVWEDDRGISTNNIDIYGTRVDTYGMPLDLAGIPICTVAAAQRLPSVAANANEQQFLVTWDDNRSGTSRDVYGARVNGNGVVIETNGVVISAASGDQIAPEAYSVDDNYLISWSDARNGNWDIYAARFSRSGVLMDTNGIAVSGASNTQRDPKVSGIGTNYFIVWADNRYATNNYDVFGARVHTNGTVADSSGIAIYVDQAIDDSVGLANDGTNYLVVWHHFVPLPVLMNIVGARVSQAGTVLDGTPIGICTNDFPQEYPAVGARPGAGEFLVAWADSRTSPNRDIYATRVTSAGTVLDSGGFIVDQGANTQIYPAVAGYSGQYLVVFQSHELSPGPARTRARLVTP